MVLGVDGGNTKTIALVAALDGTVVGSGRAGCADIYSWPTPGAGIAEVVAAAEGALAAAGAGRADVRAAVFSLAGADWPEDFALLGRELGAWLGREPIVVNDAIGAIRCGVPSGVGVAAVCGTGSAVGARGVGGGVFHIGFWPDGSGARKLGEDALAAVYREGLGVGPPTALTPAALAAFGAGSPLELLHAFSRRGGTAGEAAAFARAMLDVSASGDAVAGAIVRTHAEVIAAQIRASAARVSLPQPYPVVLAGPVFRHEAGELARLVLEALPDATPVPARLEPAAAAVWGALAEAGAPADALETLAATVPGPELFATSAGAR
ncbi:MAG TPA: BadF/BadG/BcrA/BcrD ATPase family protein [Gaiellaceae bacterium]|jgi:N-acetylglucosamine kinase-like BadF-type ATPase